MAGHVWIIIVNFRTADLVVNCLHSIAAQRAELPQLRTVIVDNASGDDSVDVLTEAIGRAGWREWASVVASGRNGGFAFGNNVGIREALRTPDAPDYILLLNPDTIAGAGAIRALVDFMDAHPGAGIAGSQLENEAGGVECSSHNRFSPLGELDLSAQLGILSRVLKRYTYSPPTQDAPHECDWVSGASLIVRRKVFETIGILDEGYFLYFEEADFCSRARELGWEIWFVPESRVIHLEGASTGIRNVQKRRPAYWYDSRRRYFVKNFGIFGLVLADAFWIVGRSSLVIRRMLHLGSGGGHQEPKWFAVDLLWGDFWSLCTGKLFGIVQKDHAR